jgi:hypothetical protein
MKFHQYGHETSSHVEPMDFQTISEKLNTTLEHREAQMQKMTNDERKKQTQPDKKKLDKDRPTTVRHI